jgi:hypothetical protein
MSHFYRQKSYSFLETDEMITQIKKEMSNYLTKEEAELIINRRNAIVDPAPYRMNEEVGALHRELADLRKEIYFLRTYVNEHIKKTEVEEPTI